MSSGLPLLSILIWLPIIGGILLLVLGDKKPEVTKRFALLVAAVTFLLSIPLYTNFNTDTALFQFLESKNWIDAFNVKYALGIDGFALPLILLSTFMTIFVVVAAWDVIKDRISQYMAAFLIMEGLMIGVFSAYQCF